MKQLPIVDDCWFSIDGKIRWKPGDSDAINVYGCHKSKAVLTPDGYLEIDSRVQWLLDQLS